MAVSKSVTLALLAVVCMAAVRLPQEARATEVQFVLYQLLSFGQGFVIAGNVSSLGSWTPASAPLMSVTDSDTSYYWLLTVSLDAGTFVVYKPVRVVYDTKEILEWYDGSNLNFTVPANSSCASQVFIVWNGSTASASLSSAATTIAGIL